MGLSYGQVVACNSLLALKSFNTFLFNFSLHEKPGFLERMAIKAASQWIERRALKEFADLRIGIEQASVTLNDCPTGIFTALYLASQKDVTFDSGKQLFEAISDTELEFERIKKPREEAGYQKPKD